MDIDVCIVACRRPDLLERTLASFGENLFAAVDVGRVHLNVDPVFGDVEDQERCVAVVERAFPGCKVTVRTPGEPSFGGAVKWLWSRAGERVVLHLEDDWVCTHPFDVAAIAAHFAAGHAAVVPLAKEHDWDGREPYLTTKKGVRLLGVRLFSRRVPYLGTSPKFLAPAFARRLGALMIPDLDPEKQQQDRYNRPMTKLIESERCMVLHGPGRTPLIRDIGREWREARSIDKIVSQGRSSWVEKD